MTGIDVSDLAKGGAIEGLVGRVGGRKEGVEEEEGGGGNGWVEGIVDDGEGGGKTVPVDESG